MTKDGGSSKEQMKRMFAGKYLMSSKAKARRKKKKKVMRMFEVMYTIVLIVSLSRKSQR